MIQTIQTHITGTVAMFRAFLKGKFLLFFIPGIVISILFYFYIKGEKTDLSGESWLSLNFYKGGLNNIGESLKKAFYGFFMLALLSPVMAILAEKYDSYLSGQVFEFSLIKLINDIIRAIFVIIISLLLEMLVSGIFWVLSWVFGLLIPDSFEPIIYFLIAAFFYGFSIYDYHLERYSINTVSSFWFGFKSPVMMILTGTVFTVLLQLPGVFYYLGLIIAPIVCLMISCYVYLNHKGIKVYNGGFVSAEAKTEASIQPTKEQ